MIKIVTGIRRSGKSFLLTKLFVNYLHTQDVDDEYIIRIALDDYDFSALREPDNILDYIKNAMKDSKMYYIIIDEVQMLGNFVDVLNCLLRKENADVYITGSTSKFLSKDVATEFRGRGDEIHIYSLSFSEYFGVLGG